ncbi:hypothetical protein D3C77_574400 [compost metagenome]
MPVLPASSVIIPLFSSLGVRTSMWVVLYEYSDMLSVVFSETFLAVRMGGSFSPFFFCFSASLDSLA